MKRIAPIALVALLSALLTACGQSAFSTQPEAGGGQAPLVPVLAVSELAVGPNRLAFGVLQNGTPVNDPNLTIGLRFFYLDGADKDAVQSESQAVYRAEGLPFGLYVGYATLDKPGGWGAEVSIPRDGGEPQVSRIRLDVLAEPRTPPIGSPAIPSENLTVAEQPDLAKLTSDANPDVDLYQLTIADAIAAQQPFVVAFSTPGYCQTAVCSPNQLVLKQLKDQYKGQVNFIHVEVYPYPFGESFQAQRRVQAMSDWNLRTEPWTFLIDAKGVIQARYEGGITFAELEPALKQLAAGELVVP
ncbi:MAG: thioredoxin family protein [Chloroflexi bacterium OHK40]